MYFKLFLYLLSIIILIVMGFHPVGSCCSVVTVPRTEFFFLSFQLLCFEFVFTLWKFNKQMIRLATAWEAIWRQAMK